MMKRLEKSLIRKAFALHMMSSAIAIVVSMVQTHRIIKRVRK
jgi:hypothetical protein